MEAFASAVALIGGLWLIATGLLRPRRVPVADRPRLAVGLLPALGAAGGLVVGWLLTGWPVAALLAALGGAAIPAGLHGRAQARLRAAQGDALAEAAAALRDAVRGGLGVQDALAGLAQHGPVLLRREFGRLAGESMLVGLPTALDQFARRVPHPLAGLLAATLSLHARLGSANLSEVLDGLAGAMRAEALTLRAVHAHQAEQRLSAVVVAVAPFVLLAIIRQTNPAYLAPYATVLGQMVLAVASVLIGVGYLLMIRIARPPRSARLLPASGSGGSR